MWIAIDRESQLTLVRQLYEQIRQMILHGALTAGNKLPSTRRLSSELSVSRNTVMEAYSQLIAEGYLQTYKGSGTVVAQGLEALDIVLPSIDRMAWQKNKKQLTNKLIDFRTGIPALEQFPRKEWGNLYRDVCNILPASDFSYCGAAGIWELREAISRYLYRARGLSCDPDRIVITSGSTQGLSLASQILNISDKSVLMENPSHTGLRKVITSAGCIVQGVPADEKGLHTELLNAYSQIAFIYTTPSHQYPMGGILPIQRRLELVRYAELEDCYIIEDDYDGEFRYEGQPVSSLYELNPERVIYLGSFSKLLAPALRLGFMILPKKLLSSCKKKKAYSDVHSDGVSQRVLAEFIQNGSFEKYLWKMKKHYSRNRSFLLDTLSTYFPNQYEVLGHATGLHLVVRFHKPIFTKDIIKEIAGHSVRIYRLGSFYLNKEQAHDNSIIFGYSHLSLDQIEAGIKIIHNVISRQ